MRNIIILISLILFIHTTLTQQTNVTATDTTKTPVIAPEAKTVEGILYGKELDPTTSNIALKDLVADPTKYEGQTINLKGDITDVCQEAGCWTKITDGTNYILVQTLHKYFLPKDAAGKISADGTFKQKEFTEEHAKEMLKESRNPLVKEDDIKGPQKVYVLEATGIKVNNK